MVRITVAEALGRYGSEQDAAAALDVLVMYAGENRNAFLNLAAWNAIDSLDERGKSALASIKEIPTRREENPPRWGNYTELVKQKTLADLP
jgi:hypothetical protein